MCVLNFVEDVPLVEFIYLVLNFVEDVPLVEFIYLVCTRSEANM